MGKNKKKRVKYDLKAIMDYFPWLKDEFELFKANNDLKQHLKGKKGLSWNRLARAFLRHSESQARDRLGAPEYTYFQEMFILR